MPLIGPCHRRRCTPASLPREARAGAELRLSWSIVCRKWRGATACFQHARPICFEWLTALAGAAATLVFKGASPAGPSSDTAFRAGPQQRCPQIKQIKSGVIFVCLTGFRYHICLFEIFDQIFQISAYSPSLVPPRPLSRDFGHYFAIPKFTAPYLVQFFRHYSASRVVGLIHSFCDPKDSDKLSSISYYCS